MSIYIVIFIIIMLWAIISVFIPINKYYSFWIFAILILFGSLRYKIGMDYESYESVFDSILNRPLKPSDLSGVYLEPGYAIILSYLKWIGFDNIALFATHMLLSLYFAQRAIMRYSKNVFISWLILYGVYYANLFFNGMRQGLFIAIILFLLPQFLENKKGTFIRVIGISIVLALFLHKTALILPIIYGICLYTPTIKQKYIILLIALVWAFTGVGGILVRVAGLSFLKDSPYLSVIDFYSQSDGFGTEIHFFSVTVLHRLVILLIALYFSNFSSSDETFKKLSNIYFWGAIIYFFLVPLGYMMATRVSMNVKIFDVLLIPYFLVFMKENLFKFSAVILISIWSFAVMLSNFYMPGNYEYYVPYRSIFSK